MYCTRMLLVLYILVEMLPGAICDLKVQTSFGTLLVGMEKETKFG